MQCFIISRNMAIVDPLCPCDLSAPRPTGYKGNCEPISDFAIATVVFQSMHQHRHRIAPLVHNTCLQKTRSQLTGGKPWATERASHDRRHTVARLHAKVGQTQIVWKSTKHARRISTLMKGIIWFKFHESIDFSIRRSLWSDGNRFWSVSSRSWIQSQGSSVERLICKCILVSNVLAVVRTRNG